MCHHLPTVQSPLELPELVDHGIGFLSDSTPELMAGALVARSWLHSAQAHPSATPQSPVGVVAIENQITDPTLAKIFNLGFTYLESVSIQVIHHLSDSLAIALQPLFGVPSISTVKLHTPVVHLSTFIQIWESCSPAIRHLDLSARLRNSPHPGAVQDHLLDTSERQASPIPLQSLRISFSRSHIYDKQTFISRALYPFDVSHLTALNVHGKWAVP
ncbi:hypothetical protein MVEN_01816100 [Mycena venus]|uniref:Uncharacterized protein n=1 Tax=Mycena venus TaxID=2733690 RepID=A0A8H7CLP4_9AGAR|nr:hypothetical protein MVEN_01816100 [Mycena venus]